MQFSKKLYFLFYLGLSLSFYEKRALLHMAHMRSFLATLFFSKEFFGPYRLWQNCKHSKIWKKNIENRTFRTVHCTVGFMAAARFPSPHKIIFKICVSEFEWPYEDNGGHRYIIYLAWKGRGDANVSLLRIAPTVKICHRCKLPVDKF